MYRIGEFSVISRVSIKMLRHYDEINLFRPAQIDPFTSYRSYSLDQLPRLNRIMALKSMGFSLAEIRELVSDPLSICDLRAQAEAKYAELLSELHTIQERIENLQTWMRRIELENAMPEYEIVLKPVDDPPQPPAAPGAQELTLPLPSSSGFDRDVLIDREHPLKPDVFACTVHHGTQDDLVQAYRALDAWIQAKRYRIAGIPKEIVHQPETDGQWVIEVCIPVTKDDAISQGS